MLPGIGDSELEIHNNKFSRESAAALSGARLCGSPTVILSQGTATRNNSNNSKATGYQNVSRQGLVTEEQIRGLKYSPCSVRSEYCHRMASLVNQMVKKKKKSAFYAGDPYSSLGREDPLEKGMATHSNILAWRSLWTEEKEKQMCLLELGVKIRAVLSK